MVGRMSNPTEAEILNLKAQIARAESERDAWRGKPSEHFTMASLLVDSLKRKLANLLQSQNLESQ